VAGIALVPPGRNVGPAWCDKLCVEDMERTSRHPGWSRRKRRRTVAARSTVVVCIAARTCPDRRAPGGNGVTPVLATSVGCTPLCYLSFAGVSQSFLHRNGRVRDNRARRGIVPVRPRPKQLYVQGPRGVS